jgi:hypothetical protein
VDETAPRIVTTVDDHRRPPTRAGTEVYVEVE